VDALISPVLVWLCAAVMIERATVRYGSDVWRNPGGWRFPKGETAAMCGAFAGIGLTVVVGLCL